MLKRQGRFFMSIVLMGAIIFGNGHTANANTLSQGDFICNSSEVNKGELAKVQEEKNKFDEMSVNELNGYINSVKDMYSSDRSIKQKRVLAARGGGVQGAWLAAAAIARKKGYPCAATLVECSVRNCAFKESSIAAKGLFAKKS